MLQRGGRGWAVNRRVRRQAAGRWRTAGGRQRQVEGRKVNRLQRGDRDLPALPLPRAPVLQQRLILGVGDQPFAINDLER